MSTPVTAGAAALLFQVNPNLTPNMVKAFLMYTAQPLAGSNMLEQGAGEINIEGAVRLARLARTDLSTDTPVGAPMLTTDTSPTPQTTIAGYTFTWSQGIVLSHHFATGINLIAKYQAIYPLGTIVSDSDGTIVSDADVLLDGTIVSDSDGTIVSDSILTSDGLTMSDGVLFVSMGTIVSASDGTIVSDGYVLLDGTIVSDGYVLLDGTIVSDCLVVAQAAMLGGDATASAEAIVDTGVDCLDY